MKWDAKKLLLIDYLADPEDDRTMKEKGKAAGYSENHVFVLLREPEFLQKLHQRTTELVASARPRIYRNLRTASDSGDTQASIGYLKAAGDIQSGVNVNTNVLQQNSGEPFSERVGEIADFRRGRTKDARRIAVEDRD